MIAAKTLTIGGKDVEDIAGDPIDEKIKKAQEAVDSNDEQKLTDAIFYNFEIPSIPNVKRSAIENAIKNLPIESKIKFLNSGIDHKFEGTLRYVMKNKVNIAYNLKYQKTFFYYTDDFTAKFLYYCFVYRHKDKLGLFLYFHSHNLRNYPLACFDRRIRA